MADIAREAELYCAERKELTLIVGVTQGGERYIRSFRSPDAKYAPIPDERSIYEIGSFSKVFTTSLLAVMESRGLISLDDTIKEHLPNDLELPPEIAEITVRDLATHTSGLSHLGKVFPKVISEHGPIEHYLRYTKEHLYEEIRIAELARPRGSGWEYSIIGMTLLGHILELVAGKPYEPLLKELVCEPLGLHDTTYNRTHKQENRVVRGYSENGQPSPVWEWDIMLPQGGLRSTLHDMLTFAEANLIDDGSGLFESLKRTRQQHYEWPEGYEVPNLYEMTGFTQGLAWWNQEGPNGTITCHAGGTFSYQSFLGVNEKTNTGLVTLTSSEKNLQDLLVFPKLANEWLKKAIEVAG